MVRTTEKMKSRMLYHSRVLTCRRNNNGDISWARMVVQGKGSYVVELRMCLYRARRNSHIPLRGLRNTSSDDVAQMKSTGTPNTYSAHKCTCSGAAKQ